MRIFRALPRTTPQYAQPFPTPVSALLRWSQLRQCHVHQLITHYILGLMITRHSDRPEIWNSVRRKRKSVGWKLNSVGQNNFVGRTLKIPSDGIFCNQALGYVDLHILHKARKNKYQLIYCHFMKKVVWQKFSSRTSICLYAFYTWNILKLDV